MKNFDILKGISVFLIIQIHFPSVFRKEYIDAIARIGVPIFFMISGFYLDTAKKTVKRIGKAAEILIVTEITYYLVYVWGGKVGILDVALHNSIKNVLLGQLVLWYPGWYLVSLIYAYVFYLIIQKCRIRKEIQYVLIAGLLFLLWAMQRGERFAFLNEYSMIFRGIPFVLLGKMIREQQEKVKRISTWVYIAIASASVILIVLERSFWNRQGIVQYFLIFAGTIPLAISLFGFALKSPEWNAPFLAYVGEKLSMYMYCCHLAISEVLGVWDERYDFFWISVLSVIVAAVIYYGISWLHKCKRR